MRHYERATFGGGCFWCTEAVFERLEGVEEVIAGYAGGEKENPSYEEVSSGRTEYAEVIQISYDPEKISYEELLEVFWNTHDPTTPNRQGPDVGPQYRSVIFYHDETQKRLAQASKTKVGASRKYKDSIVTEILPLKNFFKAEEYHQNYYRSNPQAPYCQVVVNPKLEKLEKEFKEKLKK